MLGLYNINKKCFPITILLFPHHYFEPLVCNSDTFNISAAILCGAGFRKLK